MATNLPPNKANSQLLTANCFLVPQNYKLVNYLQRHFVLIANIFTKKFFYFKKAFTFA